MVRPLQQQGWLENDCSIDGGAGWRVKGGRGETVFPAAGQQRLQRAEISTHGAPSRGVLVCFIKGVACGRRIADELMNLTR